VGLEAAAFSNRRAGRDEVCVNKQN
jgi:hypothetical protein